MEEPLEAGLLGMGTASEAPEGRLGVSWEADLRAYLPGISYGHASMRAAVDRCLSQRGGFSVEGVRLGSEG